jgi:hypothetical protein
MTEPDEALIWAREDLAGEFDVYKPYYAALIRRGGEDASLSASVRAYRAGQAASAERIKALEHIAKAAQRRANDHGEQLLDAYERIKALEAFLRHLRQWDQMNPPMTGDHAAHAASIDALLKEADQ